MNGEWVLTALACLLAMFFRDLVYSLHDGLVAWLAEWKYQRRVRNLARCESDPFDGNTKG